MNIIEINWQGPLRIKKTEKLHSDVDFGIYQIYGTHNIFGPNSLLYIGKACDQCFSTRISQHKFWLEQEFSEIEIYLGQLGGIINPNEEKWSQDIDNAERLLIYYSSPPYNTQNLNDYGQIEEETLVLNFGKKNRIPMEVSTFWKNSDFWNKNIWQKYKTT